MADDTKAPAPTYRPAKYHADGRPAASSLSIPMPAEADPDERRDGEASDPKGPR